MMLVVFLFSVGHTLSTREMLNDSIKVFHGNKISKYIEIIFYSLSRFVVVVFFVGFMERSVFIRHFLQRKLYKPYINYIELSNCIKKTSKILIVIKVDFYENPLTIQNGTFILR